VKEARGNLPSYDGNIKLVLDGQQRITTMFYAIYAPKVPLKNTSYPYTFYIDTEKVLEEGVNEDTIKCVPIRNDEPLSLTLEESRYLPFTLLKDYSGCLDWIYEHFEGKNRKTLTNLLRTVEDYEVSAIYLSEKTSEESVVEIFERINRTGIRLSTFDLVTARLYKHGLRLRNMLKDFSTKHKELAANIKPEDLLRVITLIRGSECKRRDLLKLQHKNFNEDWQKAIKGLGYAFKRVTKVYGALQYKNSCLIRVC
jgi:uncharacterized protein with ParB-like and HNH nuclease domain